MYGFIGYIDAISPKIPQGFPWTKLLYHPGH